MQLSRLMAVTNAPAVPVDRIRTFIATRMELGVGFDTHSWFVYDRHVGDVDWHMHCGPYSTREQAEWWINQIRATK
jgi:hypothetical protein